MSLVAIKSLSLTLGIPLFEDLSFNVEPGDRIGLIASNGRGKSSLLRCLVGQLEPTTGDITRARGVTRMAAHGPSGPCRNDRTGYPAVG